MAFWIATAVLTAAVVAAIVVPVRRGDRRAQDAAAYDLAVYRDQLEEVARAESAGTLGHTDAEAARAEIHRRIGEAERRRRQGRPTDTRAVRLAGATAGAVVLGLPAATVAVYLALGNPGQPNAPRNATTTAAAENPAARERAALAALAETPKSATAWRDLGVARLRRERFGEAERALKRALELGAGPRTRALYGQALVSANDGTVTDRARAAFRRAAEAERDLPRAHFHLGLYAYQQDEVATALEIWTRMRERAPADAPWTARLDQRIAAARDQLNEDGDGEAGETAAAPDLDREALASAARMDADARSAMIRGMVQRLADKLNDSPTDPRGWKRLARAYRVLDQPEKARDALASGVEHAPEDPGLLARYLRALRAQEDAAGKRVTIARRLREEAPGHPLALWVLGEAAAGRGERERARSLLTKAVEQVDAGEERRDALRQRMKEVLGAS